jgi:stage V sporulation protein S
MDVLKVSAQSRSTSVAGAIAGVMRAGGPVVVQAIGAGAVNQAVKAIVFARTYLARDGIAIAFVPEFGVVVIDGQERTVIRLRLWRPGDALPPVPALPRAPVLADAA